MGAEIPGIVRLKCAVKNYDWGKLGRDSAVARLHTKNSGEEIDDVEPYAEFWMGTHESGPSYVVVAAEATGGQTVGGLAGKDGCDRNRVDGVSLKDWIERYPSVLGDKVLQKWGPSLPFLFKVLSVEKALSMQAHPDKDLAALLHKQQPEVYKDGNHKPEMALALTEFEALCGFVDLQELKTVVCSVPEMAEVVGNSCSVQVLNTTEDDGEKKLKEVLQSLFTGLMSASKTVISEIISKLISRLNFESQVRKLSDKEELVLRLQKQYPGDIGVVAAFLFNYVKLNPGQALYLGANEPHAYIKGECVECMATSDNVVRAGLTPKHRDVKTLCSMLTYKQGSPEILSGVSTKPYSVKYTPPFDEFEVECYNIPQGASTDIPAVPGPCIFVVTAGEGTMIATSSKEAIAEGEVLFVPAATEVSLVTNSGFIVYRGGVNSRFLEKADNHSAKLVH